MFSNIDFKENVELTHWQKAYWYLRMLVNSDRYSSMSNDETRLENVSSSLLKAYSLITKSDDTPEEQRAQLFSVLSQTVMDGVNTETKKALGYEELLVDLEPLLAESKDFYVFAVVIRDILCKTNEAIKAIPSSSKGKSFAEVYAKAQLDTKGERALVTLIRDWDVLTEELCLNQEREIVVRLFNNIEKKYKGAVSNEELSFMLTAAVQEYERRAAQKRKSRAGKDLENATSFILRYFGFDDAPGPEHFSAALEVDNWLKDKNGWYIGISLKRTIRERWKQTYTTEIGLMNRYKIKYIIHLINNDRDVSDSKIAELGSYRHRFFFGDNSSVYQKASEHIALTDYVFPMSSLIEKLREFIQD